MNVSRADAPARLPGGWDKISRSFFLDSPETVAPKLLGKLLASRTDAGWLAGRTTWSASPTTA